MHTMICDKPTDTFLFGTRACPYEYCNDNAEGRSKETGCEANFNEKQFDWSEFCVPEKA